MYDKLKISIIEPITPTSPILGRKYTLTHSDLTGDMFLTIGPTYDYKAINKELRDELIGKWILDDNKNYNLIFYAYINDLDFKNAKKKSDSFKYHLQMAIKAVIFGDKDLFLYNKHLINAPIYVNFVSVFLELTYIQSYGHVNDYIN